LFRETGLETFSPTTIGANTVMSLLLPDEEKAG
jgi:hypothetical protein